MRFYIIYLTLGLILGGCLAYTVDKVGKNFAKQVETTEDPEDQAARPVMIWGAP